MAGEHLLASRLGRTAWFVEQTAIPPSYPLGMRRPPVTPEDEEEAGALTGLAQLLRQGIQQNTDTRQHVGKPPQPHDKSVPAKSFSDDLVRKLKLRQIMVQDKDKPKTALGADREGGPGSGRKPSNTGRLAQAVAKQKAGQQLSSEEIQLLRQAMKDTAQSEVSGRRPNGLVKLLKGQEADMVLTPPSTKLAKGETNYRYSGNPTRSCGACRYFIKPGSCKLVEGLIRPVDICDKFEARRSPEMITGFFPGAAAEQDDFGDEFNGQNGGCSDEDKDDQGRCPDDPEYDEFSRGLWFGGDDTAAGDEEDEQMPSRVAPVTPLGRQHSRVGTFNGKSMRIHTARREGGPGSGRRPGGGAGKVDVAGHQAALKQHGFGREQGPGAGGGTSTWSDGASQVVLDHGTGQWQHATNDGEVVASGRSSKGLGRQLAFYRDRVGEAEGPVVHFEPGTKREQAVGMPIDPAKLRLLQKEMEQAGFLKDYKMGEVSPPGWSGTVKAMKKHKGITNPWALAWWLKGKGAKAHYPPEKSSESVRLIRIPVLSEPMIYRAAIRIARENGELR